MRPIDDIGISAVEMDTGLSKDKLRIWERRYGFPQPSRDSHGERLYPQDQVEKLRLIRRLMDAGFRPGSIIARNIEDLHKLSAGSSTTSSPQEFVNEFDILVQAIKTRDDWKLRTRLRWQLARLGIRAFVTKFVANLNNVVGTLWSRGDISVTQEHLYSEQVEAVLRGAIAEIQIESQRPKILLTSLPGEPHKIGLLMLEAILVIELAKCIPLGTQTPISGIVEAAIASKVDIVALSFSSAFPKRDALKSLVELRAALPCDVSIWAGGDGVKGIRKRPSGIRIPMNLCSAIVELEQWRTNTPTTGISHPMRIGQ